VPIIALTANAVSGAKELFIANGFNDFLSKPINIAELNVVLEKWIPKEKQGVAASEIVAPLEQDREGYIKIDGIDTGRGIAMTGGTLKNYLKTLSIFYEDGIRKLEEIKTCLGTDDLLLYTTCIHALKSASASIGADKLSKAAWSLEAAGLRKDESFIRMNTEKFLTDFETLLYNIYPVISNNKKQNEFTSMELLKTELAKLKAAMEAYNILAINEAAENLQSFTQAADIGDVIIKILEGDYDEAVLAINGIMQQI
jgi:HPt (histidine-containing phosphotransfer) domain-containing protein